MKQWCPLYVFLYSYDNQPVNNLTTKRIVPKDTNSSEMIGKNVIYVQIVKNRVVVHKQAKI